jgi:hypothetical protein
MTASLRRFLSQGAFRKKPLFRAFCHTAAMRRFPGALTAVMLLCLAAAGQNPVETVPYTLHVYTDLVQIPTLVLSPTLRTLHQIDTQQFRVSLDAGPLFQPTHVRLEGDDPITLAILIDVSLDPKYLPESLGADIAALAPEMLHPEDHISIYALDCRLIRTAYNVPANAPGIEQDVDDALQLPDPHGKKGHAACARSLHLWNAMVAITSQLSNLPGRRVILAITGGLDGGSSLKWVDAKNFADDASVAIFGLPLPAYENSAVYRYREPQDEDAAQEDPFDMVCQLSGGLILRTRDRDLPQMLDRFVERVRGRYILEFPRPANTTTGRHSINVTMEGTHAFIRPAGIVVPVLNPAILDDPTTIPSDPSRTPQVGKRHILDPQ